MLISVPTQKRRKDILLSHLSELPVASDLDIDYLSDVTNGYVGADLAALCHEAAYIAMNEMGPRSQAEESKVYLCLNKGIIFRPPDKSAYWKIIFFISHPKTYVVGTRKNRLNEAVLLSTQNTLKLLEKFVLFVCFVALRPKSTAMVIAGWSVHLTTLFPG